MKIKDARNATSLFKTILSLENEDECRRFFRDLLTRSEIKEFANRWKVAQMLDRKIPYEEIARETGVSSTTIARVNKWLTKGKGGYKLMLKRLIAKNKMNTKYSTT